MNKIITLPCGLRIWVKPMKNTRSISIGVYVGAGSIYENKEINGISHFIEHMVFKGTKNRNAYQIVEEMESRGIQINAFTSRSMTAFYTISIDEYLEKCMEVLSDIYKNATFTEENMTKEKGVVIEEISMSEDDSEDLCLDLLSRAHFGDDSISYPILGTRETVKSFNYDMIKKYMDEYYTLNNTVISIVGNITPEKAKELVIKYFDGQDERIPIKKPLKKRIEPQKNYVYKFKDIEQANVAISFPNFSLTDKNYALAGLISSMLGNGMSSRLFQSLRENYGLVYNIYAMDFQYLSDGYMTIFFATNPSTVKQAIIAIREEIIKLKKEGFSQSELEKSKAQYKSAIILAAENSSYLMRAGGKYAILLNKSFSLEKRVKEIESFSLEDINNAIDYIFDTSKSSLSYVGKELTGDLLNLFIKGE